MDKLTRRELKTDYVVEGVHYLSTHRSKTILWGSIALAAIAIGAGVYFWMSTQKASRIELLTKAYTILDSPAGPPQGEFQPVYATTADRDNAAMKAFQEVANRYPGSDEGMIAKYFVASHAANEAKWADAEKQLKEVADKANPNTSSLAKLSLAQVYAAQNKTAESEKILRELIAKPTEMVSKEQATISLARVLMPSKPDEARKLLEPLRTERSAISRAALALLGEAEPMPGR